MKKAVAIALCVAVAGMLSAGCATDGGGKKPLWVTKGIHAYPDDVGKAIGGVGVAEAARIPTKHLQRTAAIERARRDVAAQLRTMVQSVFKDYSEAAFTESMDAGQARQLTSAVQKSVVDETLFGAEVADIWVEPSTRDMYAFVKLGMARVAERIRSEMIQLETKRLRVDADKAHEELDSIIEKHRTERFK